MSRLQALSMGPYRQATHTGCVEKRVNTPPTNKSSPRPVWNRDMCRKGGVVACAVAAAALPPPSRAEMDRYLTASVVHKTKAGEKKHQDEDEWVEAEIERLLLHVQVDEGEETTMSPTPVLPVASYSRLLLTLLHLITRPLLLC